MNIKFLSLILISGISLSIYAQKEDPFNSSRGISSGVNKDAFNRNRANNFNDYRTSLNKEYARMLREDWKGMNSLPGEDAPKDDRLPFPVISWNDDDRDRDDKSIQIEEVVKPIKDDKTVSPIAPVRVDPDVPSSNFEFTFMNTQMKVRVPSGIRFSVDASNESSIADAWEKLSGSEFSSLVADCQKLKSAHKLCDWAYLNMLYELSRKYATGNNSAVLLTAYLFSQSGYRIRIGEVNGNIDLLYASKHLIYDKRRYEIDGYYYYPFLSESGNIRISNAFFQKEQSLSLWIPSSQSLDLDKSSDRSLKSSRYPEMEFVSSVNKNLIDFYDTYPTSMVGGNLMTRWAMYANTPICEHVKANLYPQIKSRISGLNEYDAVQRILNWVQTAFVYELDDVVWGGDRAFFPEETLYYKYCDCEDRSLLFTRLIRDLLGLKCILVYYPGHLAAAVAFNNETSGDYILYNGTRFIITDPTYIGAPVGRTMPDMDNASAKVILLE